MRPPIHLPKALTLVHAAQGLSAQLPLLPIFKQLLGFYAVVSDLDTLYGVDFPDQYTSWLAVFSFLGFGFDGASLRGECVGGVEVW